MIKNRFNTFVQAIILLLIIFFLVIIVYLNLSFVAPVYNFVSNILTFILGVLGGLVVLNQYRAFVDFNQKRNSFIEKALLFAKECSENIPNCKNPINSIHKLKRENSGLKAFLSAGSDKHSEFKIKLLRDLLTSILPDNYCKNKQFIAYINYLSWAYWERSENAQDKEMELLLDKTLVGNDKNIYEKFKARHDINQAILFNLDNTTKANSQIQKIANTEQYGEPLAQAIDTTTEIKKDSEKIITLVKKTIPEESLIKAFIKLTGGGMITKRKLYELGSSDKKLILIFKQESSESEDRPIKDFLSEQGSYNVRGGPFYYVGGNILSVKSKGFDLSEFTQKLQSKLPKNHKYAFYALETEIKDIQNIRHGKDLKLNFKPEDLIGELTRQELTDIMYGQGYNLEDLMEKADIDFFIWKETITPEQREHLSKKNSYFWKKLKLLSINNFWDLKKLKNKSGKLSQILIEYRFKDKIKQKNPVYTSDDAKRWAKDIIENSTMVCKLAGK